MVEGRHTIGCMYKNTHFYKNTQTYQQFQQLIQIYIYIFFDECISTWDLRSSFSTSFVLHDFNSTINVYIFIVSSCSSEGARAVLLLPVTDESHRRALVKHHREKNEASLHVCALLWKMCFILFRVGVSELLLWWWPLRLDQGQRRRPALGDDAWSVR